MHSTVFQLHPRDNVLIALADLNAGAQIEFAGRIYRLPKAAPAKHKFAMRDFAVGDDIIMYGVLVGCALKPIASGELLTTVNIQHLAKPFHGQSARFHWTPPDIYDISNWHHKPFLGYGRSDGQVGTRNYWLAVPLVFCENKNIQAQEDFIPRKRGVSL
jgi:altronate hydrolase